MEYESHKLTTRNITIKLLQEVENRTTFEYTLKTLFYKINTKKIIEDINSLDGIDSVEKV